MATPTNAGAPNTGATPNTGAMPNTDAAPINGNCGPKNPVIVNADHVHKYFGSLHVLNDVSLQVCKNEVLVIIGPSGSGKSTFLRVINHLEKIDSGRITVNGHLIGYTERSGKLVEDSEKNIAAQRMEIGMVFQRFNLFPHLTALENIMEAPLQVRRQPRDQVAAEAQRLLARVGLAEKADNYPSQLSGGQQQRVAIARAAADRVIFMDEGRIVEQGSPEQMFNDPQSERTKLFLSKILH